MMNFHPPLSSAPAVLLISGTLLEVLSYGFRRAALRTTARGVFLLGIGAIPLSYLSGLWAEEMLPSALVAQHQLVIDSHEGLARLCLFLSILPLLFLILEFALRGRGGEKAFGVLYLLSACVLSLLIARTSFFGGELVFQHGLGVELRTSK